MLKGRPAPVWLGHSHLVIKQKVQKQTCDRKIFFIFAGITAHSPTFVRTYTYVLNTKYPLVSIYVLCKTSNLKSVRYDLPLTRTKTDIEGLKGSVREKLKGV